MATVQPESDESQLQSVLRAVRPGTTLPGSLERRLAVDSILSAAGAERAIRLGRLEVQSRIGGGAMGVVYRAYDPDLRRLVAVKLLRGWTERAERLNIADEARGLARLNHPNIVAVYDIVDDDEGLYFTMEYVSGTTLAEWLSTHPSARWREIVGWFVQAGRGLGAAHGAGLIHRDFKPDNVLVGDDDRVRVVDFGLARALGEVGERDRAGTPYYMAPEVTEGGQATTLSDQYSFGVALRDALADRDAPPRVTHAIERAVAPNARDRHTRLDDVVEQLEAALNASVGERQRALLLDRVERLWLRGVLERSGRSGSLAPLDLCDASELVDPPWQDFGGAPDSVQDRGPREASSRELGRLLELGHGTLLIVGPPGAGKTTLLLLLCRDLWRTATVDANAPAPAVLSLSTFEPSAGTDDATGVDFHDWVVDELVTKYGLPRPAVKRWLDDGTVALLLDGLDESHPRGRARVVDAINAFRRQHPLVVAVSARDSEYAALDRQLAFGRAVAVQPLGNSAIRTLLEERHALGVIERLPRDANLRQLLQSPLFLALYADEGQERDGMTNGAQASWAAAYERYVSSALSRTKPGNAERLSLALTFLARAMRRQSTSDLWLERLHFGWLEKRWETLAGYACGLLVIVAFSMGLNLAQIWMTPFALGSALTFGLGAVVCSLAYTRGRIAPVESLALSWHRALRLLPLTTACALTIGLLEALKVNFASNMAGAAATGAVLAPMFALEPGERATRVHVNAGIHQSLSNALRLSAVFGVSVGLLFGFVVQPYITHPLAVVDEYGANASLAAGVAVGLFAYTSVFLIYGGFAALMHTVLRVWLALRTPLPLRLVPLLDEAVTLGLMRHVGGGYVFLHLSLLEYFAAGHALGPDARGRCAIGDG